MSGVSAVSPRCGSSSTSSSPRRSLGSGLQQLFHLQRVRREPAVESDQKLTIARLAVSLMDLLELSEVEAQGLLDADVFAGGEHLGHHAGVDVVTREDEHRSDLRIGSTGPAVFRRPEALGFLPAPASPPAARPAPARALGTAAPAAPGPGCSHRIRRRGPPGTSGRAGCPRAGSRARPVGWWPRASRSSA